MKTLNFFNQDTANKTSVLNSFQNEVLTLNEMFTIRGGNGDEEDDDDSNGSTEDTQEDNFN